MNYLPDYIAILLTLLLACLVVALIFRRDFRDALIAGPGEVTFLGFLTVKGVAIVLLCGLLIGGILFALKNSPAREPQTVAENKPIKMRLNVNFDPNEVNPRNPNFKLHAFIKTPNGNQEIRCVPSIKEGGLSIEVDGVPDMETPFFIVFDTPKGTWQTDDYSITEAHAIAHKQGQE